MYILFSSHSFRTSWQFKDTKLYEMSSTVYNTF